MDKTTKVFQLMHYFAIDGNYGDATSIAVIDTKEWNDEDWALIDEASDDQRPMVAEQIAFIKNAK